MRLWYQHLKLSYDEPLSNFAFKLYLRRYSTVVASTLSYLKLSSWVIIITAAGTAITSWMEFSNVQQKIERYTRAVRALKMHLNWWSTLDTVERQSLLNPKP
jgi:arginine exporter protein ArgO